MQAPVPVPLGEFAPVGRAVKKLADFAYLEPAAQFVQFGNAKGGKCPVCMLQPLQLAGKLRFQSDPDMAGNHSAVRHFVNVYKGQVREIRTQGHEADAQKRQADGRKNC